MPQKTETPHKYWNVRASADSDTAEITLYGEVVSDRPIDWYTWEQSTADFIVTPEFRAALEPLKAKSHITIKIDSAGGDLYAGIAIHNALKALPAHKTVVVEGVAMSSASIIAMAGDDIQMYPGSIIMIHGCSFYPWEPLNQEAAESYARAMDTMNTAMANIYAEKTGLPQEDIRAMMKAETWMTDSEAIQKGFADTKIKGSAPVALSLLASGTGQLSLKNGGRICTNNFKATVPARFGVVLASKEKKQPETNKMGKQYIAKMIAFAKKRVTKAEASFKADGSADVSQDIEDVKELVSNIRDELESSDEDTTDEKKALEEVEQALESLETSVSESDGKSDEGVDTEAKNDESGDGTEKNLAAIATAAALEAIKKSGFKAARAKETAVANQVKPTPRDSQTPENADKPQSRYAKASTFIKGVKALMKGKAQG